ncbi:MAG: S9 family peptidase [Planctomycetes bacterium]|nr:S9 family peptidase [Planctomycetota bacterium]
MSSPKPTFVLLIALSTGAIAAQTQRPQGLSVAQALALRTITNPRLGADFVAFTQVVPRPLADGPGGAYLHVGVLDGLDRLAAGERAEPRWLVDGRATAPAMAVRPGAREVSFLRPVAGAPQVFVQSIDGGEPQPWAATPAVSAYRWRPDGQAIAFTSLDAMPDGRAAAQQRGFAPVVVDEDWRHLSLWLCEAGAAPRRLTDGATVFGFEWSPDGSRLVCAIAPRNLVDDSYMFQRLHVLDVATGARTNLVDNPGKLGAFTWTADGAHVAYVSAVDRNDPHAGTLYRVEVATGDVQPLTYGLRGMVEDVQATAQGLLVRESLGVRTQLSHRTADKAGDWLFQRQVFELSLTDAVSDGRRLVFTASAAAHPAELFVASLTSAPGADTTFGAVRRLTDSNRELAGVALGAQSVVRFRARDGLPIEGVLIEPVGHVPGTRVPLVIVVHGGPEAHFRDGWLTSYSNWGQLLAARGYASWYPNYRASTGYGVEFCKQNHGDPMGREFQDHLDAIAWFDAQGRIDVDRVGIGGGSYGGYTAAWAATKHSEHFAAAVSFVPFVDLRTKWLTSDIPWEFYYVHYQEQWPWQQPGLMADRSPLTWAERCRTPLLLLGGTEDSRVHPSQPFQLYRAVKFASGTPVRYVQYPGEGHGNRSNVYQYDYALRSLQWFDHYLQGDGDRRAQAPPPPDLDYGQ